MQLSYAKVASSRLVLTSFFSINFNVSDPNRRGWAVVALCDKIAAHLLAFLHNLHTLPFSRSCHGF